MQKIDIKTLSPLALAFLGDAIHTTYIRLNVLEGQKEKLNTYHSRAKSFCNAKAQADALEKIENVANLLDEEEREVIRKARNAHNKHQAKNFDEETYKKATSFESLVGFLYLSDQISKLEKILKISIEI